MVTMYKRQMIRRRQEWLLTFRARQWWAKWEWFVKLTLIVSVFTAFAHTVLP